MQWQRDLILDLAQEFEQCYTQERFAANESLFRNSRLIHQAALDIAHGANEEGWSERLLQLMNTAHENMRIACSPSELTNWRMCYTDSCILRGLSQSILSSHLPAIGTLDRAIIIAGPTGNGRLDLILNIIAKIQLSLSDRLSLTSNVSLRAQSSSLDHSQDTIPSISPPSFLAFQSTFSKSPFILRKYACDWPALTDHAWKSATYLHSVAGPGRIVPVEIGRDYRSTDWKQDLMQWEDFLSTLDFEDQPPPKSNANLLYLAQHDLMKQFPSLREGIRVPDYVYATLSSDNWPDYHPPNNDDQIILNTWLGPEGAMSPAHTDPYYNCYTQIVGFKMVWLAPPSVSSTMCPFKSELTDHASTTRLPSSELGNTSQLDVFAEKSPDFAEKVIPFSRIAILAPGDMLFFPPGWWHAMKSETTSISLSMWF